MLEEKMVSLVVQINGKLRDIIEVCKDASEEEITKIALNLSKIQNHLTNGIPIKKVIFVQNKMINFVI
jgi:leucyl-tRNA synthetase